MDRESGSGRPARSGSDPALVRAVRSLARNRELKTLVEGRIERAQAQVVSYLLLHGIATASLGGYQVDLEEGEVRLTQLPGDERFKQMRLPGAESGILPQPASMGSDPETELIDQAQSGKPPCPRCGQPLCGERMASEKVSGVLLYCPDVAGCGYQKL